MKTIALSKGYETIVDDDMFEVLSTCRWHAKDCKVIYAAHHYEDIHTQLLQWYITGRPIKEGLVIDHINGNTLDNRRENLRIVTHRNNSRNFKIHRECKLVGVSKNRSSTNPWTASFYIGDKKIFIGNYSSPEAAHGAYLKKCEEHENG